MEINTELFQSQYNQVVDKLRKIADLPHSQHFGSIYLIPDAFVGLRINNCEVDGTTITYISEYDMPFGGGIDTVSFTVPLKDLNKPLEHFQNLFAEKQKEKEEANRIAEEKKNQQEIEQARKTLQKHGITA